jgi:hypothetical protein
VDVRCSTTTLAHSTGCSSQGPCPPATSWRTAAGILATAGTCFGGLHERVLSPPAEGRRCNDPAQLPVAEDTLRPGAPEAVDGMHERGHGSGIVRASSPRDEGHRPGRPVRPRQRPGSARRRAGVDTGSAASDCATSRCRGQEPSEATAASAPRPPAGPRPGPRSPPGRRSALAPPPRARGANIPPSEWPTTGPLERERVEEIVHESQGVVAHRADPVVHRSRKPMAGQLDKMEPVAREPRRPRRGSRRAA